MERGLIRNLYLLATEDEGEVMNEPTMDTLARRLDRVERENRRMKRVGMVALAVMVAVVLMGQATTSKVAEVIEAEKFVVVDKRGNDRVILEVSENVDIPSIQLLSTKGKPHVSLKGAWEGTGKGGSLTLSGPEGKGNVEISTSNDHPSLSLEHDAHWVGDDLRGRRISLTILPEGSGLTITDKTGKPRVGLNLLAHHTTLHFTDEAGNNRVWLILDADGPKVVLLDADENARAILGRSGFKVRATEVEQRRPESSLVLLNKAGEVIWEAP
jgi:hypothetical protein